MEETPLTRLSVGRLVLPVGVALLILGGTSSASANPTIIDAFAGGGSTLGDGGPATSALLGNPSAISPIRNGTAITNDALIADSGNCSIRRVTAASGRISTVAGGDCGVDYTGPYTNANPLLVGIGQPTAVSATAAQKGGFLFAHGNLVEKWVNGSLTTVAGTGHAPCNPGAYAQQHTLGPVYANATDLCTIQGLSTNPADITGSYAMVESGSLYLVGNDSSMMLIASCAQIAPVTACLSTGNSATPVSWSDDGADIIVTDPTFHRIWRFDVSDYNFPSGNIVAGGGADDPPVDGEAATSAFLPASAAVAGYDGTVYISVAQGAGVPYCRILRVSNMDGSGTLSTVAGVPPGPGACDTSGLRDGVPATASTLTGSGPLAMTPNGLLEAEGGLVRLVNRTSITAGPPQPPAWSTSSSAAFTVASLDTPAHVTCNIDVFNFQPCSLAPVFNGLGDSDNHQFFAMESNPPADPSYAQWNFQSDTKPPLAPSLAAPDEAAVRLTARPEFDWSPATDQTSDKSLVFGGGPPYAPGSGVAGYELWIDNALAASGACCTLSPTAALAEGHHTWFVRAIDTAGNAMASATRAFDSGGNPPTAAFTIAPNPALPGSKITVDGSSSSDPDSAVAHYEWDFDGDGSYETDGGSSSTSTTSYPNPGTFTIGLRVTDPTGRSATTTNNVSVNAPVLVGQFGVTVNNGAQYTRDPRVTVSMKFPSGVKTVLVSNDGGFLAPQQFAAKAEIPWRLDSSGPERLPKIVYVRFLTGPIVSETHTDDIILDEVPPVVKQATLAPATAAASAARLKSYVVKVKATDSNSGVSNVQVTANKKKPGKLVKYKTKLTVKSATRPKFLRAQDRAGNFSAWKKLR